ncbi:MAG: pyrroloquinoline quinone precursor peptide PqqA [Hyphomicrobiales bacterium]|nr:MAG: pyrroloquinoline quinone precursor peptide PqqA [Hyphomicrobiales bacterium]
MTWESPTIQDIACGMEVTAYAPSSEGDDLHATQVVVSVPDADS